MKAACSPPQSARVAVPIISKKSEAGLRPIGALDQVWRTAVRADCAAPDGLRYGAFQWDLEKFYEHPQHPRLIDYAARLGMPVALVRATIRAYRLPRLPSQQRSQRRHSPQR